MPRIPAGRGDRLLSRSCVSPSRRPRVELGLRAMTPVASLHFLAISDHVRLARVHFPSPHWQRAVWKFLSPLSAISIIRGCRRQRPHGARSLPGSRLMKHLASSTRHHAGHLAFSTSHHAKLCLGRFRRPVPVLCPGNNLRRGQDLARRERPPKLASPPKPSSAKSRTPTPHSHPSSPRSRERHRPLARRWIRERFRRPATTTWASASLLRRVQSSRPD